MWKITERKSVSLSSDTFPRSYLIKPEGNKYTPPRDDNCDKDETKGVGVWR